jgi:hypothetical protein
MSKVIVAFFVVACLLACTSMARERDMSEREFYELLLDSKKNSAHMFRLIRETKDSYYIESRSSPLHGEILRVSKAHLHIRCVDGAEVPCVIKEKMVVWVDN